MVTIVSNTSDCNDGDIRLVGGASKYEGTIEICFGNLWGLIAETGWGDHDAQVVCRQLGYIPVMFVTPARLLSIDMLM